MALGLSIVIPHYMALPGKAKLLSRCIESLQGHDELIVIGHNDKSLPWAINQGARASRQQNILILSDDMFLSEGSLADLAHPRYVTHPLVNGVRELFGGAICYPRWVFLAMQGYDERFLQGFFDDDDAIKRAEAITERRIVPWVNVAHPQPSSTLGQLSTSETWNHNKALFESIHGEWSVCLSPPDL